MKSLLNRQELVDSPDRHEPHVVILGAGRAKQRSGMETHGRLVPLMNELPEILGGAWRNLVEGANLVDLDFESQFTRLRESPRHHERLNEIEDVLWEHFSSLALPEGPTITTI